jgi:hypothetical protein
MKSIFSIGRTESNLFSIFYITCLLSSYGEIRYLDHTAILKSFETVAGGDDNFE